MQSHTPANLSQRVGTSASRRVFVTEIQHGLANNPILYNIKYPINRINGHKKMWKLPTKPWFRFGGV
jgi:hypothetical protein